MKKLTLFEIGPSPNCMKARLALNLKGLEYEKVAIDFQNRSRVIEVSTQPLVPVLKHGDTVIFDSRGILRYLDANVKKEPRLYSDDSMKLRVIEGWEDYANTELFKSLGMAFHQALAEEKDEIIISSANQLLASLTEKIENALQEKPFLLGNEICAADITAVPILFYTVIPAEKVPDNPISQFISANLKLGTGREKTREWVEKVAELDN
ncbi:glutathione S-transferase family protein [Candidatus Riflebacteria bacterium]